jgi:hypothetical protein
MPIGFCSRDPVGFEGGNMMYLSSFVVIGVDPMGTTTLRIIPTGHELPKTCGSLHYVKWVFRLGINEDLEFNYPICDDGYEGYLVQKVTAICCRKKCADCPHCPTLKERNNVDLDDENDPVIRAFTPEHCESFSYLEAWEVNRKGKVKDENYTDRAAVEVIDNTCGYTMQLGYVKYFCKNKVDFSGWHPGSKDPKQRKKYGKICETSPGELPSIDYSDPRARDLWSQSASGWQITGNGASAERDFLVRWDCCGPSKWVDASYSPDK